MMQEPPIKDTVLFCANKVSNLARYAGDLAEKATSPKDKLNALIRQEILLEVETVLLKSANGADFCGSCGQWVGGPMQCCAEAYDLPEVSEVDAFLIRRKKKGNKP